MIGEYQYNHNPEMGFSGEENEPEDLAGEVFDAYHDLEDDKAALRQVNQEWQEKYGQNPESFFDDKNLDYLKTMKDSGKRMMWFARTVACLSVSPELADKYYTAFPQDREVVNMMSSFNDGRPATTREFNLFSVTDTPQIRSNNQFVEMIERRRYAPNFILKNFEWGGYDSMNKEFGNAANGFWKTFREASDMRGMGDHFLDVSRIFNNDFEKLSAQQKSKFLRQSISELHHALLFDETFNSCFTREMVDADRQRQVKKRGGLDPFAFPRHDEAHSMIFRTYQPISVYDLSDSYFEYEMTNTAETGGAVEEYPFQKMLLAILRRFKNETVDSEKNVDVLVDFWNKNRNPIFGNAIADTLSAQNPDIAAKQILEILNQEKMDKNALTAILYRLEFGRVGISKNGVRYLEKIYDLGEYNNPDYHARRLTASGEVGIFDEEKELIKYFHLGDLSSPEKMARAQVLDFTYDTLFVPRTGENAEERNLRMKYLEEFKANYYRIAEDKIFAETDVRLNNLSFKEQGWFLISFNGANDERKERMRNLVRAHGENGLKTFFSLGHGGPEMGDVILSLTENLAPEVAQAVFTKYSDIMDAAQGVAGYLQKRYGQSQDPDSKVATEISENLLGRGKDLLVNLADEIKKGGDADDLADKVQKQLEWSRADVMLLAASYKSMSREKGATIESVRGISLETKDASELTSSEKDEMMKMYIANRPGYPPELLARVVKDFEEVLAKAGDKIYILYDQGGSQRKIISFIRYGQVDDGKLYLGSFNVAPEGKYNSIGGAMLASTLEREGRDHAIELDVYERNPIIKQYLSNGFQTVAEDTDYHGTGQKFFKMERPAGV